MKFALERAITLAILLAVLFGVAARVAHLERKLFFQDEAYSALRITGHTQAAYLALFDGRIRPLREVLAFQRLDPSSSVVATLRSIAREEPQRGPLYYVLAELWAHVAGTSIAGYRSLAAAIGVLEIAAAFWFGWCLFGNARGAGVLAALVATSPFAVLYAQQTREYGLMGVMVFAAGACLLGALERGGWWWAAYSAACALGFATSPLFWLVALSHAAFVALTGRGARAGRHVLLWYGLATVAAGAVMLPWVWFATHSAASVANQTEWGWAPYPFAFALAKWAFNIASPFFDFEFASVRFGLVLVALLPLIAYLAAAGVRRRETLWFAVSLALPTLVAFVGKDALSHSHFSTIPRYLVPVWCALQIAVAGGIVAGFAPAASAVRRRATAGAFVFLLACGAFSVAAGSTHVLWWSNNDNVPTSDVARVVNRTPHALVTTSNVALTLSLVHYLQSGVSLQLHERDVPFAPASRGPRTFLFLPSQAELAAARRSAGPSGLRNVGPQKTTVVREFHAALARERPSSDSRSYAEQSAQNALWSAPTSGG